ncbi:MAG TPA: DUF559 domain-containing protein [Armatimonadota bacterium]|jgi:very-short-patch-repair endonuclease
MNNGESWDNRKTDLLQPLTDAEGTPLPRPRGAGAGGGAGGGESGGRKPPGPATVREVASREKVLFAREQRRQPTQMEARLWQRLRGERLGFRFRRQHPVGDFVLDFYCPEAKLAVELDGPHHQRQATYDQWRTEELARAGIEVLRIPECNARERLDEVLGRIRIRCGERTVLPHPPSLKLRRASP